ncbi:aspartate carbamoyltransferase catalytic subunit, partial [Lancefieldella parvula]
MLSVKHLIDTNSLTHDDIQQILDTAQSFEAVNNRDIKKVPALRGRTIVNLFLEPSTRTRSSFELAEKRLSADALNMGGSTSSVVKGESLADTIQTIDAMNVDMFICRARLAGTPQKITENTDAVVINAGDGKHQHPTQAMLDLYTIRKNFGHLDGLKVAIVGDLSHSRVVGSLVPALKTMGAEVVLVGPPTFHVDDPSWFDCYQTSHFDEVIGDVDVVYMLRVQLERMEGAPIPSRREYNRLWGLDERRSKLMKPEAIICHPGPMNRGMEINSEVADCVR